MTHDLAGQRFLFADMEAERAAADRDTADALRILADGLPDKETVTVPEARRYLFGVCRRTVENLVSDGTLMVGYANRSNDAQRNHARIIVRADRPFDPQRKKYLTLAELRRKRSNVDG
jgi:hypothetical protein